MSFKNPSLHRDQKHTHLCIPFHQIHPDSLQFHHISKQQGYSFHHHTATDLQGIPEFVLQTHRETHSKTKYKVEDKGWNTITGFLLNSPLHFPLSCILLVICLLSWSPTVSREITLQLKTLLMKWRKNHVQDRQRRSLTVTNAHKRSHKTWCEN